MGIINVTPDSFSDGGRYVDVEKAVERARQMARDGAEIVDIGGESTRPGARPVEAEEEVRRVLPVVAGICQAGIKAAVSIDTSKAAVAEACIRQGVDIVNDISGLRGDARMMEVVAASHVGLVIMHMQGTPGSMQLAPSYSDVVDEVGAFLERQVAVAEAAGVERDRIVIDPGIGFGKSFEHNIALLRGLPELRARVGRPVLVGASRKSLFAALSGAELPECRLWPTVATTCLARELGAMVHRVHDVAQNVQALRMIEAMLIAG